MKAETFIHRGVRFELRQPKDDIWLMPGGLSKALELPALLGWLEQGKWMKILYQNDGKLELVWIRKLREPKPLDQVISKALEFVGFGVVVLAVIALMTWLVTWTARR